MSSLQPEGFYKHFVKAMHEGNAAIFAGAGLSKASGFVDWKGLLKEIATDLKLDIDQETDLIAVAQYHHNKQMSRAKLDRLIVEAFTKDTSLSENHRLLANLPLDTVWTTNYDKLIEEAFAEAHRRVDVKRTPQSLQHPLPERNVTIYKMHGDIDSPQDAVLTKEDYETYALTRELFSIKLKGDLVGKTFLFIGFSFTDPNIEYILSRIRNLLGKDKGEHYCIMRWPAKGKKTASGKARYEYERTKLELRIADLKRYGIEAIMVDEYADVTKILAELSRRVHLRDVFVSGSAAVYEPFGESRLDQFCRGLGATLVESGLNLVSGVGLGIGGNVIVGAMEMLYAKHYSDASRRLFLRPFPQHAPAGMSLKDFWTKYRREMLAKAGVCIFVAGNRLDSAGTVVEADGVFEEFEIARILGKYVIPIGATGHAAKKLWEKVSGDLDKYFPEGGVKGHFKVLGSDSSTNEELLGAVVGILKQVKAVA
jgi:Sir2- and TIR-associating SLOG family/SIR2-like domain